MKATFTRHAIERLNDRLHDLVTALEVTEAIDRCPLHYGENYIDVKFFEKRIYLGDPNHPDTPKGDKITVKVIVDNQGARIITIMLRKSTSVSERYAR